MLECIFTIDYEIYGNGHGSLRELVFEPADRLRKIFDEIGAKFVVFVEVAELEKIDALQTDSAIQLVKNQIREFFEAGFEIALHLHPQWCNADYQCGKWELDYTEYNLCTLPMPRITEIVDRSITFLRTVLQNPYFIPTSFRAGNWLFQPTAKAARVLMENGIRIDSSVFKGGRQHLHNLDYRSARKNDYYWRFTEDVTTPNSSGALLEIPIYTKMVPFWRLLTAKRVGLQRKASPPEVSKQRRLPRLLDFLRFSQPLKFDYCRMTLAELVNMTEWLIAEDQRQPELVKPIVLIGHTKDLLDFETIRSFLSYLRENCIPISTLESFAQRYCARSQAAEVPNN